MRVLYERMPSVLGTAETNMLPVHMQLHSRWAESLAHNLIEMQPPSQPNLTQPQRPSIPPKWSANVSRTSHFGKLTFTEQSEMASDTGKRRLYSKTGHRLPFAPLAFVGGPLEWLNITTYAEGTWAGEVLEGQKYLAKYQDGFHDIFRWVRFARYDGNATVNSTVLQRWQLKTTFPTTLSFVLYADGDVPVSFEQNLTYAGGAYSVEYRFLTFAASAEIPHVWDDFNRSAFSYTPPCPTAASGAPPPPRTQSLYIFHPRHDFNISQQDIADAVGDVFFLCQNLGQSEKALERPAGEDYEWISEWRVELIPRWGQYQNCNGYPSPRCLGDENFWVGHEAAIGLGQPRSGQCEDNPLVGEWYSLPEGGHCPQSVVPDGRVCTWRESRAKTIDAKCLLGHGFADACRAGGGRAPFRAAEPIFRSAFATDDPAAGGCQGLPGPDSV